ncbi:HPP family protein [Pseudomonas sp. MAP12]|uniref:HPP family protein n=1 Tax=Geopseudomonas aromaticivorans TaxID=2849492 RepID=A0ABS6N208_9GAMM|nr:HPP family protein [Pseudomonas aromaticivorans]MBV2135085.1 HPP family protein [Pseudomonas aromaticivorans]
MTNRLPEKSSRLPAWLSTTPHTRPLEWLRAASGALLGVAASVWLCTWLFDPAVAQMLLGPLGASAVLLFAVSSGALSQPWSILGSYLLAGLSGALMVQLLGASMGSAVLAMAVCLLAMFLLRCLHPPAAALTLCVVLVPGLSAQGFAVVLPVMFIACSLFAWAVLFNNLTGVRYPRLSPPAEPSHHTADLPVGQRMGIGNEDLDHALDEFGGFIDLTREDLATLVRRTEQHALRRQMGELTAAQIMSRDLRWVTPETTLDQALEILQYHHLKVLPVLERDVLVGVVTLADLIELIRSRVQGGLLGYLGRREVRVSKAMTQPAVNVAADTHVVELIPLLSREGLHGLPVLEGGKLVGIVSQTDLIAALQRQLLGRSHGGDPEVWPKAS